LGVSTQPVGSSEIRHPEGSRHQLSWNNLGQLLEERLPDGGQRKYRYDALGRQITRQEESGAITHYQWAAANRLAQVTLPGGATRAFSYNAYGNVTAERDELGRITRYEYADNLHLVSRRINPDGSQLRYRYDNSRLLLTENENERGEHYHLAALDVSEIDNPLRFQGQYFDAETGLHYNRHRYYNPGTGRFLTPDPIKLAGGLNSYQYVPNPTGWVDPLGLNSTNCPKKIDTSEYQTRKDLRTDIYDAKRPEGRHATKHTTAQSAEQAKSLSLGQGTRDGKPEASYLPDIANNVSGFEKQAAYAAVRDGNVFDHGGSRYMFYRSETPVGYNNGELTNWVRIELSKAGEPVIHNFPAAPEQVKKYMGNVK
jgi:RHS repeat-associated protein